MRKLILILFLCAFVSIGIKAQNVLVVQKTDLTEQTYDLGDNGAVYFNEATSDSQSFINIVDNEGNSTIVYFEDMQKIYFRQVASISDVQAENTMFVYPNPAKDYIKTAGNANQKQDLSIYSLDGKLLLQGKYANDEKIDITFLEKGVYVLKCSDKTFKFSKL